MNKNIKLSIAVVSVVIMVTTTVFSVELANKKYNFAITYSSNSASETYSPTDNTEINTTSTETKNDSVSNENTSDFSEPYPESEDPQKFRANGQVSSGFSDNNVGTSYINNDNYLYKEMTTGNLSTSKYVNYSIKSFNQSLFKNILNDSLNGSELTHDEKFNDYLKYVGIDVSDWQGTIDWASVANSGVQFAIIRCGYRGYVSGKLVQDQQFDANMQGALSHGIKVGVYFFSMAINESEASEEAQFVLDRMSNYSLSLPIYMDTEFVGTDDDRLLNSNLSSSQETSCVLSFCNTINSRGYSAGEYANANFLEASSGSVGRNESLIWQQGRDI